ncbi:hypothetical protein KFE25_013485 [Diacronema lutheri]|uniref:Mitochondrial splicing suppressor 51-like C-terminal domain-containing protein n=1 Tax=Diacronema lutheri TaxID=2081491 RepID=A0A8J5XTW1_DIALT|nr:hypothetical protein KFE25_013485 [Diacronema lutheri]
MAGDARDQWLCVSSARARLDADARWLAEPAHKACFFEPALNARAPHDAGLRATSWSEYWRWRGWSAHASRTLGAGAGRHAPLYRHLSAMLTFPMTLAHVLIRRSRYGFEQGAVTDGELSIAVIGARAEAALPPSAWLELAHAVPAVRGFALHMIGPAVSSDLADGASREVWETGRMRMSLHRGYYHELCARADCRTSVRRPDAYVLFHPGLAHHSWQEGWRRTVRSVLASRSPALVTGFSAADSAANLRFIAREGGGMLADGEAPLRLWANPFASARLLLDEGSGLAVPPLMQPNQSFFVFRAR